MFTKKDIVDLYELAEDAILYAPEWAKEKYEYEKEISKFREKIKNLGEGEAGTGYTLLSDVDSFVKSITRSGKGFIFEIELSDDEIDKRMFNEREQIIFDKKEHGNRYRMKFSQEILLAISDYFLSNMGTD